VAVTERPVAPRVTRRSATTPTLPLDIAQSPPSGAQAIKIKLIIEDQGELDLVRHLRNFSFLQDCGRNVLPMCAGGAVQWKRFKVVVGVLNGFQDAAALGRQVVGEQHHRREASNEVPAFEKHEIEPDEGSRLFFIAGRSARAAEATRPRLRPFLVSAGWLFWLSCWPWRLRWWRWRFRLGEAVAALASASSRFVRET
jgi:hypothetical protein